MLDRAFRGLFIFAAFFLLCIPSIGRAQNATLNGPCVAPVDLHTCIDVRSLSVEERNARNCLSNRCPGVGDNALCCLGSAPAPDACGQIVQRRASTGATLSSVERDIRPNWVCRMPPAGATATQTCRVYETCYPLNPQALCCPPDFGTEIPRQASTNENIPAPGAASALANRGIAGRLNLPNCATTHDPATAGDCSLDDIIAVGVSFANFLMGLAAAVFLGIFVWAGFKYIFFAYDPGVASQSRQTLVSAAIGMLLVLGAATIVRFVYSTLTATPAPSVQDRCVAQKGQSFACQNPASLPIERRQNCAEDLCADATTKCCPVAPASLTPSR